MCEADWKFGTSSLERKKNKGAAICIATVGPTLYQPIGRPAGRTAPGCLRGSVPSGAAARRCGGQVALNASAAQLPLWLGAAPLSGTLSPGRGDSVVSRCSCVRLCARHVCLHGALTFIQLADVRCVYYRPLSCCRSIFHCKWRGSVPLAHALCVIVIHSLAYEQRQRPIGGRTLWCRS